MVEAQPTFPCFQHPKLHSGNFSPSYLIHRSYALAIFDANGLRQHGTFVILGCALVACGAQMHTPMKASTALPQVQPTTPL